MMAVCRRKVFCNFFQYCLKILTAPSLCSLAASGNHPVFCSFFSRFYQVDVQSSADAASWFSRWHSEVRPSDLVVWACWQRFVCLIVAHHSYSLPGDILWCMNTLPVSCTVQLVFKKFFTFKYSVSWSTVQNTGRPPFDYFVYFASLAIKLRADWVE